MISGNAGKKLQRLLTNLGQKTGISETNKSLLNEIVGTFKLVKIFLGLPLLVTSKSTTQYFQFHLMKFLFL